MVCAPIRSIIPSLRALAIICPYRHTDHDLSLTCSMADGIFFDISLSFNFTDLYKREEELRKTDSNFQILEVRLRSVRSASLFIHRKWLLHHQKVTIGMEHKDIVHTQVRLLHLIRVCTTSCSAVLNQHKRKYGYYSILNDGPKYLSVNFVSRSYCSI